MAGIDLAPEGRLGFALRHWHIKGQPLSFRDHAYLRELFLEEAAKIVVKKATQIAVTEWLIVDGIWFAATKDGTVIYAWPARTHLGDMVAERIDPPLQASPYLSQICSLGTVPREERYSQQGVMNKGLKRVRDGWLYLRGITRSQLISVPADMVILDEFDRIIELNPLVPVWADERLGHSKFKWWRYTGVPSYPDVGIDAEWQQSSQGDWMLQCTACNEWQTLTWEENVVTDLTDPFHPTGKVVCAKCRKETVDRLADGEFVHRYPDREVKGYHINKLISSRVTIDELVALSISKRVGAKQIFQNSHMGEVYAPKGDKVSEEALLAAIGTYHASAGCKVDIMGIDPGHVHHWKASVVRDGKRVAMALGVEDSWPDLEAAIKRYDPDVFVMDAQYDPTACHAMAAKFGKRAFLADTTEPQVAVVRQYEKALRPGDKPTQLVSLNRDAIYQDVLNDYMGRPQGVVLPLEVRDMRGGDINHDFFRLMAGVQRVKEMDEETGNVVVKFIKGAAHFFDADALERVAMTLWLERRPVHAVQMRAEVV